MRAATGRGGNAPWKCMSNLKQSYHRWLVTQRRIVSLLKNRDYSRALLAVNLFLRSRPARNEQGEALGMRSSLWESLGEPRKAHWDMAVACRLSSPASFSRYARQVALGAISQNLGATDEAIQWYRKALRTALAAGDVSCGTALRRYLALRREESLTTLEKRLCHRAVYQSNRVLNLKKGSGQRVLTKAVSQIYREECRPVEGRSRSARTRLRGRRK